MKSIRNVKKKKRKNMFITRILYLTCNHIEKVAVLNR